ncbi:MAG: endonuclease/exonuclease/phosphatase family protein [Myxococcales bacterium]|nr:endonuclease/exonuclease/phosphatase family protein [Myxococcales bacterium]
MTKLMALLAVGLVAYVLLGAPATRIPPRSGGADVLRVATSNVYALNPYPKRTAGTLAALDADVLLVLEVTGEVLDRTSLERSGYVALVDRFADLRLGFGTAVFVRASLAAEASLVPPPVKGACQPGVAAVRLDVGQAHVALLGAHFAPPACTDVTGSALDACAAWIGEGRLLRDVGPCRAGDAVLVLGDLNVVPYAGGWASMERAGLRDAWGAVHWRPGPTWAQPFGLPSLLRIDAVLAPATWDVLGCWTLDLAGSDHDVVVADLRVRG